MTEQRLLAAVAASRSWYDDLFALHGIPVGCDGTLWWAEGEPPRWPSVVKTLVPTTDPAGVLRGMEAHPHGTVADSFGLLDLGGQGFELLLAATWLHHPGVLAGAEPPGWSRVLDAELMTLWNQRHDTVGVLPADLWAHPRFTVLARHTGGELTGGAILHDTGSVVGLSNTWGAGQVPIDPQDLLDIAASTHSGRPVVAYARGAELEARLAAGFAPLGPQHVWIR